MATHTPVNEASYAYGDQLNVDYLPGVDTMAGTVVQFGSLVGVTNRDIGPGYPTPTAGQTARMTYSGTGALGVEGVYYVSKAAGTNFTAGAEVQWDNTGKLAVTAAGDFRLGVAVETTGTNDPSVLVQLGRAASA